MEQIVLTKIDNAILMNKGNETDISKAKAFTSRYELSQEIDKVFESIKNKKKSPEDKLNEISKAVSELQDTVGWAEDEE